MASEAEHLTQARHNEALTQLLAKELLYRDWILITAFYAALHYVEASFAKRFGFHGEAHGGEAPHGWRLSMLRDKTRFTFNCYRAYQYLYASSRAVRYLEESLPGGASFDDQAISKVLAELAVVKKELKYK
jgi:hypothetical protein